MQEIVILSGKGGTGKTSIVGSLAVLAERKVLADCDVDAADLHLLLKPSVKEETEFWSGQVARIDADTCTQCGLCRELCRFGAISGSFGVDPTRCEGCGFCTRICPVEAIAMNENLSGHLYISDTKYGPLVHARLGIAQENSGKLVALVRKQARSIASEASLDLVISDGPPGIGCPVISSLSGADIAVLVTEPTLSGIHDLERVISVCDHFGVPAAVCINKCDINLENAEKIESYCAREEIPVAARIPFDNAVTGALVRGLPVIEYAEGPVSDEIRKLWYNICGMLSPTRRN